MYLEIMYFSINVYISIHNIEREDMNAKSLIAYILVCKNTLSWVNDVIALRGLPDHMIDAKLIIWEFYKKEAEWGCARKN